MRTFLSSSELLACAVGESHRLELYTYTDRNDTSIRNCAAADGNSMSKRCTKLGGDGICIPGCSPAGQDCDAVRRTWDCSYPPSQLQKALQAQRANPDYRKKNNEMVVDVRSVTRHLPNSIEAFFFMRSGDETMKRNARLAYSAFLAEYPRSSVALLQLDLESPSAPFSVL